MFGVAVDYDGLDRGGRLWGLECGIDECAEGGGGGIWGGVIGGDVELWGAV